MPSLRSIEWLILTFNKFVECPTSDSRYWFLLNFEICSVPLALGCKLSKLMLFGSRQMRAKLQFHSLPFMGKDIVPSDTAKDLGVILDSNLTYDEHIIKTASSCMSRLGQINRVKHVFDKCTLLMIINSLVFSKLLYCSNVWANTSKCNINKLQAVQNFACRIVSGARKYDHITPICKELNWLPVANQLY